MDVAAPHALAGALGDGLRPGAPAQVPLPGGLQPRQLRVQLRDHPALRSLRLSRCHISMVVA